MAATPIPFASKDNASGQLQATISNSTLSIVLQSGNGANFPQPYTGTATSLGTATTLNSTGISAAIGGSAAVGKFIWNKTDGSVAVIKTVSTNSLTTTALLGGTANIFSNADTWCIDAFVATFATLSTSVYGVISVTTYEEALIVARSTDTLTVASGGRGYNGTIANTFNASDYVYLDVTSPIIEKLRDIISVLDVQIDSNTTSLATQTTNIGTIRSNADFFATTTGSANAYAATYSNLPTIVAGLWVCAKANFSNTGAATFNYNGGGAIAIKKQDGATALASGDWASGQIAVLEYDGSVWQMLSPPGQAQTQQGYYKQGAGAANALYSTDSVSNTAVETAFTTKFAAPANYLVNIGDKIIVRAYFSESSNGGSPGTLTLKCKYGTSAVATLTSATRSAGINDIWSYVEVEIVALTVGASGKLQAFGHLHTDNSSTKDIYAYKMSGTSTDGTITSFDTTAAKDITFTATFSNAAGDNLIGILDLHVAKVATSLFS